MRQVEALRQPVYLRSVSQIGRLVQGMSTFSDTCLDGHAMPAVALAGRPNQRLQSSGAPRARRQARKSALQLLSSLDHT
jgi:hypothetical protein